MPCFGASSKQRAMLARLINESFHDANFEKDDIDRYETAIVAQHEGRYVAVLFTKQTDTPDLIKIECLCVEEKWRKNGLGSEMLQYLQNKTNIDYEVEIDNDKYLDRKKCPALQQFYKKNGFTLSSDQSNTKIVSMVFTSKQTQ